MEDDGGGRFTAAALTAAALTAAALTEAGRLWSAQTNPGTWLLRHLVDGLARSPEAPEPRSVGAGELGKAVD